MGVHFEKFSAILKSFNFFGKCIPRSEKPKLNMRFWYRKGSPRGFTRSVVIQLSSSQHLISCGVNTQGAPLTNFNDEGGGGSNRGSYFVPEKITTSEFVYPKKSLLFLAYPKKSLSPFFATQKSPSVFFCNPKKSRHLS